ncbi:hypothetical protein BDW74DRAFT_159931 [Aspergillus multicolor]|uniref:uncharacterized protein n=1 Tax=Aspergillus multicolor TaxID=41759 RepID=UPI003CCD102E
MVGAAVTLMEFLPDCSAMDADGGHEVHLGQISAREEPGFLCRSCEDSGKSAYATQPYARSTYINRFKVEIASVRFLKTGTIIQRAGGSSDAGPIPKLGGPFSTATSFFKAWAKHAKFPVGEPSIRRQMGSGPVEVLRSINTFSSLLHEIAGNILSLVNDIGPFPVYPPISTTATLLLTRRSESWV